MVDCTILCELVLLAFVLCSGILLCDCVVQSSVWKHEPAYDGRISDEFIIDKLKITRKTKCVSECDKRADCASIFFINNQPPFCQLHRVRFPAYTSGVQKYSKPKSGTKYYYNEKENAITTTTTTTSTTTTTPTTTTTTTTPTTTQQCPGYENFPTLNKYMKILPPVNNWNTAKNNCGANGGYLMSVKDSYAQGIILDYATRSNAIALWVNAKYDDFRNDFVWQDDFTSLNNSILWQPGQPQYPKNDTKCVMMLLMFNYNLDDTECMNTELISPLCYCL